MSILSHVRQKSIQIQILELSRVQHNLVRQFHHHTLEKWKVFVVQLMHFHVRKWCKVFENYTWIVVFVGSRLRCVSGISSRERSQ